MVHPNVVVPRLKHGKLRDQFPRNVQDLGIGDETGRRRGDDVKGTGHEFPGVHPQQGQFPVDALDAVALQLRDVTVREVAGKVDL